MHSIDFTFTSETPFKSILDSYMNDVQLQVAAIQKCKVLSQHWYRKFSMQQVEKDDNKGMIIYEL